MQDDDWGAPPPSFERWLAALHASTRWYWAETDDRDADSGPIELAPAADDRVEFRFEHYSTDSLLLVQRTEPGDTAIARALLYVPLSDAVESDTTLFAALRDAYRRIVDAVGLPTVQAISRPPPVAVLTVDAERSDATYRRLGSDLHRIALNVRQLHQRLYWALATHSPTADIGGVGP